MFVSTRLISTDVPALTAFYRKITGLEPTVIFPGGEADYVEFRSTAASLCICSLKSQAWTGLDLVPVAGGLGTIIEFKVDDVDSERLRLTPDVTEWVAEPTDQPWGNRSMIFRDPDGNLVNVYTVIGTPIADPA